MTPILPADIRRILIIRSNHRLGNNVLMTPLLAEIDRLFPQASVEVLTGGGASHLLYAGFANVTAVHAFPSRSYVSPREVLAVFRKVRAQHYDLIIDPIPGSRSARFLLALIKARYKLGYRWDSGWDKAWRNATLTHAVDATGAPAHYGQTPVHLLRAVTQDLSADTLTLRPAPMPTLDLRLTESEKAVGETLLDQALDQALGQAPEGEATAQRSTLRVGLYCVATGAKQYSPQWWSRFVEVLQRELTQHETAGNAPLLIEFLPHDGKSTFAGRLPSLLSVKLRELCAALAAIDVFVTADCGVMHLASAAGTQTLGLFKVTDVARYGPYGHGSASIAAADADPEAAARKVVDILRKRERSTPP